MAKFVVYDSAEGDLQEFSTAEEVESWLKEDFDGDPEDVQVFEVETEYKVEKSFDLVEV